MVTLSALWLPIVLSAVGVFITSALVWMVLPHHKSDFKALPNEDGVRAALGSLAPGVYNVPHVADPKMMEDPELQRRFNEGPVGFFTVLPNGVPSMGKSLGQTFVFYLVVGVMIAYVTGRSLPAGAEYLQVFRLAGVVGWLTYGWAAIQDSIWFGKPWSHTVKGLVDALLYGLITAGFFGWLWPA